MQQHSVAGFRSLTNGPLFRAGCLRALWCCLSGPSTVVESTDVIAEDLEIYVPNKNIFLEYRIVLTHLFEMLRGERRENDIARLDLCTDAGELTDLLWAQI